MPPKLAKKPKQVRKSSDSAMSPKAKKSKQDPVTTLSPGNINFTKNLYSILSQNEEGNILFSPFSIQMALILIYIGAKENTEKEIREALQLPVNKDDTLKAVKSVLDVLEEADVDIFIANGLFPDKKFKIKKDFDNNSRKYFSAFVKNFDFQQRKKTIDEINKFVEKKTNNKIMSPLNQNVIKANTRAFVVNTVYFKGFWENKFSLYHTEEENFHINKKKVVKVDFMNKRDYFMYSKNPGYHMVKLPYQGNYEEGCKCYMILIVPIKVDGLESIENQIKELNLIDLIKACSNEKFVYLKLPKFELNEGVDNVENVLKELQMNDLFDFRKANLKGMSDEIGLYLDDIFHKCFLQVTEKGTEAAARTIMCPPTGGTKKSPKPIEVKADRPFLFFIYDSLTEMILFFGRVKKF